MAQAQGGGRSPVRIEWTAPESVKAANHTVPLSANGGGAATFRVGYSGSSGGMGGGPTGATNMVRFCQAGTRIEIPLLVAPDLAIRPHMVSITPDKASFDISTQPGAPGMGGQMMRYSENHVLSVHYEVANLTVDLAMLNITTGPSKITGPGCQPSTPSVTTLVTSWVNFTMPAKPATIKAAAPPAESPGVDFVSLALVAFIALAFVGRRTKG